MKVSFVSSQAISQALRYQTLRMQAEIVKGQTETTTGRHADVGLALGALSGQTFSMAREIERIDGVIDANQLAKSRLSTTQVGLQQITEEAEKLIEGLVTARGDVGSGNIVRQQAKEVLGAVTSILNTQMSGQYIFAGINTDAKPITNYFDADSEARDAFESAFTLAFPEPEDASADDILAFLEENAVQEQFFGDGWNENWSNAADQQIISRITLGETAETSVSANNDAMRKIAMAASTIYTMLEAPLGQEARNAVLDKGMELLGSAIVDLANQQSFTGITEARIDSANERLSMQKDIFTRSISDMEGVDPYEALTNVNSLMAQLEISYAMTGRMQQMSLLRFLS